MQVFFAFYPPRALRDERVVVSFIDDLCSCSEAAATPRRALCDALRGDDDGQDPLRAREKLPSRARFARKSYSCLRSTNSKSRSKKTKSISKRTKSSYKKTKSRSKKIKSSSRKANRASRREGGRGSSCRSPDLASADPPSLLAPDPASAARWRG
ncbi:unnamed protein product [Urochloa humidicola]